MGKSLSGGEFGQEKINNMSNPNYADATAERNEQLQAEYDTFIKTIPDDEYISFDEWVDLM